MDIKNFIKNWKDELRSEAKKQPGVQSISIVEIGKTQEKMLEKCKEVGIIGFVYRIPTESGITTKELRRLLSQSEKETKIVWLELPVPDFIDLREIDDRYYKLPFGEGVVTFLKSQNIEGGMIKVLIDNGYEVEIGEHRLRQEDIEDLAYCVLLENVLK